MFRAKGPGCALAMNEQITPHSVHEMTLDLASVVRDIEQKAQFIVRKEVREDAADVMAENLAIGERAIDRRPHRAEVALTDLRIDRRAGEFAIGKVNTGLLRSHDHLFQKLGSDLMAEAPRAAVNGHDNAVLYEPEGICDHRIKNLGHRLDLEIVIARAKRSHFPALAFLGAVRHEIRPGTDHSPLFLDPFKVAHFSPAARNCPMGAFREHGVHLSRVQRDRAFAAHSGRDLMKQ